MQHKRFRIILTCFMLSMLTLPAFVSGQSRTDKWEYGVLVIQNKVWSNDDMKDIKRSFDIYFDVDGRNNVYAITKSESEFNFVASRKLVLNDLIKSEAPFKEFYKKLTQKDPPRDTSIGVSAILNVLGSQGWEMVSSTDSLNTTPSTQISLLRQFYFKKRVGKK